MNLWDNIKLTKIPIIGFPEEKKRNLKILLMWTKKLPQILERHASRGPSFILFSFLPKIANLQSPLKHALCIEKFL